MRYRYPDTQLSESFISRLIIAFLRTEAIHCVFSLSIISYPTNAVDFQSKNPTKVALVGFPVNGFIT